MRCLDFLCAFLDFFVCPRIAATEVLEHLHNSEDGYRRMMLEDAPDMIQMY